MQTRRLDGGDEHAGHDERRTQEGDGGQDLANKEKREHRRADRLEREGEPGGLGGNVRLHVSLSDEAVSRADERECDDDRELGRVDVLPPDGEEKRVTNGIYAEDEVLAGIQDAQRKITAEDPDRIVTVGGNCMVSLAPFDYLHGKYENVGIIWIDAHPDVSTLDDGYPNAHAMVLGSLLGKGAPQLVSQMRNPVFKPSDVLYIGLQQLHDYQESYLNEMGIEFEIQTEAFATDEEIKAFISRFDHILVHFDIDVLDEHLFHSTYFANPELVGDGAGGGKMSMEKLSDALYLIADNSDVVGFTVAEYLPFDDPTALFFPDVPRRRAGPHFLDFTAC